MLNERNVTNSDLWMATWDGEGEKWVTMDRLCWCNKMQRLQKLIKGSPKIAWETIPCGIYPIDLRSTYPSTTSWSVESALPLMEHRHHLLNHETKCKSSSSASSWGLESDTTLLLPVSLLKNPRILLKVLRRRPYGASPRNTASRAPIALVKRDLYCNTKSKRAKAHV